MTSSRPSFTAFLLAQMQLALIKNPRWRTLVPEAAVPYYAAFTQACNAADSGIRLVNRIPDPWKLGIIDHLIVYGMPLHMALRKQAIEAQARACISEGVSQVVVIGAGFDTLALRLAQELPGLSCIEIDQGATQRIKREALAKGTLAHPANCMMVEADLSVTALRDVLATTRFDPIKATLFIAEGLTMYLTEEQNRRLFHSMMEASGDCRVVFTAIEKTGEETAAGRVVRRSFLKRGGEKYRWSIARDAMEVFLAQERFQLNWCKTYAELQIPYRSDAEMQQIGKQKGEHIYYATGRGVPR